MIANLKLYKKATKLINQKLTSVRDFSKKMIQKAKNFIEFGNYVQFVNELDQEKGEPFIDDGLHFKYVELELLIENEFKSIVLDYQDTDDKKGYTLEDIENLKHDMKERYANDNHTGVVRYRLFNSEFSKMQTPFIEPAKNGGLALFADIEYMIDNKIQKVTINAKDSYNQKGFAIRDLKNLDYDLKAKYGFNDTNGVLRFKLYSSLLEYRNTNYVYMNVQKVMTHSDLFDYFIKDKAILDTVIGEEEKSVAYQAFIKWFDMYNAIDAKIPRYAIYSNGQNFPLEDFDKVYYYEGIKPKSNIQALPRPEEYILKRKPRNKHHRTQQLIA